MNSVALAKSAPKLFRLKERGITIREQPPQEQLEQPEAESSNTDEDPEIRRKGKKPVKQAPARPSAELPPSSVRKVLLEATKNRMRTEA